MKTSFVATIYNEALTVVELLDSISQQSQLPDEVILVDAGSTDETQNLIRRRQLNQKLPVRLLIQKNANRSQGRNLGIQSAKYPVIVLSDAGCVLDSRWLERITRSFATPAVEAVAGYYQTSAKNILAKCFAPYLAIMPDKLNLKTYLPSSRSLAFRKSAWQKIGGYPEKLNYCEDLVFAQALKAKTQMVVRADAIVFWQLPTTFSAFYQQLKNYSSGDVLAGYWPHIFRILTVYLRYIVFFGVPALFFAYLFWPIIKFNHYVKTPLAWIYLPLAQVTADLAVMRGALLGLKIRLGRLIP